MRPLYFYIYLSFSYFYEILGYDTLSVLKCVNIQGVPHYT